MATRLSHNKNNSAVKRIMQEARELANDPSTDYTGAPLEDDIFEWHCTLRGPAGTEFEGGLYHFRILLPAEYPFRPPAIMMLTPSGRFELNTKICISFTNYHEDQWQPAWGVRTAIIGLQGFFPLKGEAAVGVGALEMPVQERKRLAGLSREWCCPHCKQTNLDILPDPTATPAKIMATPATAGSTSTPPTSSEESDVPAQQTAVATPSAPAALAQDTPDPQHNLHFVSAAAPTQPVPPSSVMNLQSTTANVSPLQGTQSAPLAHTSVSATGQGLAGAQQEQTTATIQRQRSSSRPPILLDSAILVLVSLVLALLAKKFA